MPDQPPPPPPPSPPDPPEWGRQDRLRRWKRWTGPALTALLTIVAGVILWGKMREDTWAYLSDGAGLKAELDDERARPVLWEDPEPHYFDPGDDRNPGPANDPTGRLEAAFSADGTTMLLTRWDEEQSNADMFLSRWDGRTWSKPQALDSINTKANERGPALSRDGQFLYFASDREGGKGGYDLYVARWNGKQWTVVEALPSGVNTGDNELGPALSPDGTQLFFSSDSGGSEDIFVSNLTAREPGKKRPPLAPIPEFASAEPVSNLNSSSADVEAALTTRGDHVFLASDRARSRKSGFKLYFSRVVDGEALRPEQVDLYIRKGDVTDPAVRMDGFDLLFSSNQDAESAGGDQEPGYRLYRSTTREVIGYTDLSRWEQFKELMSDIAWWILLALVALIALIYILERWRDMTSLFHKCLAGSALLHLLALLLAMVWLIAKEMKEDDKGKSEELIIDVDALSQEELALESIPEETELADTTTNLETQKEESEFGAPGFEPQEDAQPVPDAARAAKEAVVEAQPQMSEPNEQAVTEPTEASSVLSQLTETVLPEIEPTEMEERDPSETQPVAETSNDVFEPPQPMTESTQVEPEAVADNAVESEPEASEVTEVQPDEPADQPRESVVETTVTPPTEETPTEQPPLESTILADLTQPHFEDPNEAALDESNPANAQASNSPADPSQDLFNPGGSVPNLSSAQSESGSDSDSAMTDSADPGAVGAGDLVAESSATDGAPAPAGESAANDTLPATDLGAELPDLTLNTPDGPPLEEPDANPGAGPANPSEDLFEPDAAASGLATNPASSEPRADSAMDSEAEATGVATATVDAAPSVEARPTELTSPPSAEAVPASPLDPGAMADLPTPVLPDPGGMVKLEELEGQPAGAPADPSKDQFKPDSGLPSVATSQAEGGAIADTAATSQSDATAVTSGGRVADPGEIKTRPASSNASSDGVPVSSPLAHGPLPGAALPDPGAPTLEEPGPPAGAPADPSKDQFKPGSGLPSVATSQASGEAIADTAATTQSDATAVASGGRVADPGEIKARPAASTAASEGLPESSPLAHGSLPGATLPDPGAPKLEEPGLAAGAPADTTKDQFKPGGASQLATSQTNTTPGTGAAVADSASAASVSGAARDNAANAPMPGRDLEAGGSPVPGGGLITTELATLDTVGGSLLPSELEAPKGAMKPAEMARIIQKQRGKPGLETIKQMGGSDGTEEAIKAAMKWLVNNQEEDGRWDTRKHNAKNNYDHGAVGLALLCFYGWGERHDQPGKYQVNIKRALEWLLAQQDEAGFLGGRENMMYSHSIASIALCEAYGLTKDPRLKKPAERAIAYTLAAQSKTRGGWRYGPGNDSDTSITGWQYMALHSARMAGLEVPEENFERVRKFLDRVGGGKHGGIYGYQRSSSPSRAMVATGMFCRQLDLVPPSHPRMMESARYLKTRPMKTSKPDLYYVYYTTLALYQHQGPAWLAWNERLKETLPLLQNKTGSKEGSWDPSVNITAEGGRVVSTTLATLSLEVYYRLLPMYGFRNDEAEAPEKKVREN